MEQLVDQFLHLFNKNFDLSYMLCVNVLAYMIIKLIDDLNGDKVVGTWTKRAITVISCFVVAAAYKLNGYNETVVLINSAIIAPVAWSWIFKPILNKFGVDYKKINKPKKPN